MTSWMQTHGGRPVSFLVPDPESISIDDIALHLSRIPRFVGATRFPYSVAQHSLHVMQIVKEASPGDAAARLWALLHDAHESLTSDLTTPFQNAVRALLPTGWPDPIETIQTRLDKAIARRFGIDWADAEAVKPFVKRADMIALATEKAQLLPPMKWDLDLPPPCEIELQPLAPANAEWLFRLNFERCLDGYRYTKRAVREAAE